MTVRAMHNFRSIGCSPLSCAKQSHNMFNAIPNYASLRYATRHIKDPEVKGKSMREFSPVIPIAELKPTLEAGGKLEVECVEEPTRVSNQYQAVWKFYALAENGGQQHRLLLVHGRDIKPRIIRTLTGLLSFAMDLGVSPISIPRHAGERAVWEP